MSLVFGIMFVYMFIAAAIYWALTLTNDDKRSIGIIAMGWLPLFIAHFWGKVRRDA